MADQNTPPTEPGSSGNANATPKSVKPTDETPAQPIAASGSKAASRARAQPKTEFERQLGMADKIVKISAIVIGGIFAFVKFGLLDLPNLQKTFSIDGNLEWLQDQGGPSKRWKASSVICQDVA
jgi:hypothetical protein